MIDKVKKWLDRYFAALSRPVRLVPRRWLPLLLAGAAAAITLWQYTFRLRDWALDRRYVNYQNRGVQYEDEFTYFHYYLNLYPVATLLREVDYSREGALEVLNNRPDTLVTEVKMVTRVGDHGVSLLFLLGAMLRGTPEGASINLINWLAFTISLIFLFTMFAVRGRELLGCFLVVFLGSNPFQLLEVNLRDNVFSWPISTAVFLLAAHALFFVGGKPSRWYRYLLPIASGCLLASVRQVRMETTAMILGPAMAYAFLPREKTGKKLVMIILLAMSFQAASMAWSGYFQRKIAKADHVVGEAGGTPFPVSRDRQRNIWHPLWCGLGDFDTKYGYVWDDGAAGLFAAHVLQKRYGIEMPNIEWFLTWRGEPEDYWDEENKYIKAQEEVPYYGLVLRERILSDITGDPLWYLGILLKRAERTIVETTPVRIAVGDLYVTIPYFWPLALLFGGFLVIYRKWDQLKMIIFVLPLAVTPILIYSGGGTVYYNIYHLVLTAILVEGLVKLFAGGFPGRKKLDHREGKR